MTSARQPSAGRRDHDTILESLEPRRRPRTATPALVLTVGLPGSGKSSFSRRLAIAIDAVILESDALRRRLFGSPTYAAAESRRLFAAIYDAATALLADGVSLIVDSTSVSDGDRAPAAVVADATGARLIVVSIETPAAVIEERLRRRAIGTGGQDSSETGRAVHDTMRRRLEPIVGEHWRVDTSDPASIDAACEQIAAAASAVALIGGSP